MSVHHDWRMLYKQGLTDKQIGEATKTSATAVGKWRRSKGLPSNAAQTLRSKAGTGMRFLLHDLGWGMTSIAKQQGVSRAAIKDWRNRVGLKPNPASSNCSAARREKLLRDAQKRVVKAIGNQLPLEIASDAAAELMLALMEGKIRLHDIEKEAPGYISRAFSEYSNAFRQVSLDEEVPGSDGLCRIDTLRDETSVSWLEEMGATWH